MFSPKLRVVCALAVTAVTAVVVGAVVPLNAQTAAAPSILNDSIGSQSMRFAVRPGECALERSNASDKRVLDQTQSLIQNSNTLHVMSVDCKELADWRAGRVKFLGDGMQIQSLKATAQQDLRQQSRDVIAQVCREFRNNAGDVSALAESEVKKRIDDTRATVRLESLKLLGVTNEDDSGCYVAARVAGKNEAGGDIAKMMVFVTTVLEGKIVYIYRFSNRFDQTVLKDLMADVYDDLKRQVAANRR
jgi:hypothetical protein